MGPPTVIGGILRFDSGVYGNRARTRPVREAPAPVVTALYCAMHVDLTQFTEDELIALNRRIVERISMIRAARQLVALSQFSVGMRVEFTTDDGRTIEGTITKLNRRTATLCSEAGGHWRVSPSLLRPVASTTNRAAPSRVHPFHGKVNRR